MADEKKSNPVLDVYIGRIEMARRLLAEILYTVPMPEAERAKVIAAIAATDPGAMLAEIQAGVAKMPT